MNFAPRPLRQLLVEQNNDNIFNFDPQRILTAGDLFAETLHFLDGNLTDDPYGPNDIVVQEGLAALRGEEEIEVGIWGTAPGCSEWAMDSALSRSAAGDFLGGTID